MLFFIFLICTIVLVVSTIILVEHFVCPGYLDEAFGAGFVMLIACFFGFGIALTVVVQTNLHSLQYHDTEKTTISLKALGNKSAVDGQFFLGGGYIGEKQVINYVRDIGSGGSKIESMPADQATLFEDTTTPHLNIIKTVKTMPDVIPWYYGSDMHYDFHIPAGSVLQNYKVDVSKEKCLDKGSPVG